MSSTSRQTTAFRLVWHSGSTEARDDMRDIEAVRDGAVGNGLPEQLGEVGVGCIDARKVSSAACPA